MVPAPYSSRELVNALTEMGYQPVDRAGSHLKLRYTHPETGEIRNVTIPMGKEISGDTLRNIATQCGANDFQQWCNWIDELL
ncbi:type II toxin-antitoxin system HicA family toxin [Halovenus salina]|uniref:type II toxin-antitoxin system HicA family toxin n=2 Tax=Halovenus salina TaxID=1510225 RepID=UPI0034A55A5D